MDRLFVKLAVAVITLQFTVSRQSCAAVLFQIQMSYTNKLTRKSSGLNKLEPVLHSALDILHSVWQQWKPHCTSRAYNVVWYLAVRQQNVLCSCSPDGADCTV
jgi:hypothetical protein